MFAYRMVLGEIKEVAYMKLASFFVFGGLLWFALPVIVPMAILYILVRLLNAVFIGRAIEEVHHDN